MTMKLENCIKHFKLITKHKLLVMKLCFKCGLIKRGLLHDLSKYSPIEFLSSARYFTGTRSPIAAEKEKIGYSNAWQHHKGHNPHHWEYWIDNVGTKSNDPIKIPYEYVIEMICDWIAASIIYSNCDYDFNDPYPKLMAYYKKMLPYRIFHPDTQKLIEYFLTVIKAQGINAFCDDAKKADNLYAKRYRLWR